VVVTTLHNFKKEIKMKAIKKWFFDESSAVPEHNLVNFIERIYLIAIDY